MRQLRLRMSDETIRSVMVDENQPVANLMVIICTKLGITNHDEYSLISTGKHTINGRRRERKDDGRIIDQKMEQLKKKLKTDEDLAWVDHSKTLDEQDIHEQDVVLLRRRFFYSDQNIDSRDPIQLGLLFVQTRDAILSGTHPVTIDGACKFAGIQCQAQLGDFMEAKTTRPGYFNLKDYLPAEYAKQKHIERKIFIEHKKYYGLSELEAKAKYVSEARSLSTYGVTFFLVKEKVAGKNKLVPRLLGITKDCVMRVDADTKAILKTWPLTTVKRWAASMNSFTLDFGDYSDSYYSVQTTEGEQISQLIAGYIDIILKRRKAKDHFGIEGDEGATMIEDSVAPSRATIIQNQPTLQRPPSAAPSTVDLSSVAGPNVNKIKLEEGPIVEPPEFTPAMEIRGKAEIGYESKPLTQYVTNYELSLPQRDLQDRLEQAQDSVEEAQKVLDKPQVEVDRSRYELREVEQKKRKLSSQFAEINAATAELVSLSAIPEEELNYNALNSAVETVDSSLPAVAKEVKIVASLMEDEDAGERLNEAARRLCKAFSDLLNAAEPGPTVPRQSLISAASRVGDATQSLMYIINSSGSLEAEEEERERADVLLSLAKSVASSAAALVLKAKDVASTCRNEELQNLVIGSATQCALATSQTVATAKIVAPTINDAACQRKLLDACREVHRAVEGIRSACQRAIRDDELLCDVNDAVDRVNHALNELMNHVRSIKHYQQQQQQQQHQQRLTQERRTTTTTTTTTNTTNTLSQQQQQHHQNTGGSRQTVHKIIDEGSGRPLVDEAAKSELVNQARTLARATAQLVQAIRPEGGATHYDDSYNSSHQRADSSSINEQQYTTRSTSQQDERMSQQQQQQHYRNEQDRINRQHQQQQTTTTITTTVYDEQQQRDNQNSSRPVSMYDTETSSLYANSQQNKLPPTTSYDSTNQTDYNSLQRQQQQQHHEPTSNKSNYYDTEHQQHLTTHTRTTTREQYEEQQQQQEREQQQLMPEAAISGIVGDLETTIVWASAGTLRPQDERDSSYLQQRENVLRCAKALVEDTRPLVASAASNESQLAQAAQESVFTMSRLAEAVKSSAASLGPNNSQSQVSLIRSVKEVAVSLADLIGSTKSALGVDSNDPRLHQVKDSAKTMVTSVTSLLKTVKSVEDEQQRGVRAIEAALEVMEQELVKYQAQCSHEDPQRKPRCSCDELIKYSRQLTMATSKTVNAGSSGLQDDAIVAANMGRLAIIDLLHSTRSCSFNAESYEMRSRLQQCGRECALNYKQLLELLLRIFQHPSIASANPDIKQELISRSKQIGASVSELVNCSELLKKTMGSNHQQLEHQQQQHIQTTNSQIISSSETTNWENADPDDPNVIAESELLGAASSIDAAAKKLENLKPRVTSVKLPHEDMNFDEIILEAAKSIIEATAALLRAASASQRELIVDGRLDETETFYASDNNQWSEGLISAARMVAAATHSLVEAANALVQGQASEERLISAAKQVASSTNQLLVACKVKADPDSRTMSRLASAGNQVKRATDNLVRAAQQAIEHDEEQSLIISNRKVSGIAQEISAREQILRKEKELQVAKTQLMAIRKAKYSNRPDDYQGYGGSLD